MRKVDVVKIHITIDMPDGANGNNAGLVGGSQRGMQTECQGKVPEMIGRKLELVALSAEFTLWDGHDTGIIDKDVKRAVPRADISSHRREVRQVEYAHGYGWVIGSLLDILGDSFTGCSVTDRQCDVGSGLSQCPGGFHSDPTGTTRHNCSFATEIDACHNFHGGRGGTERCRNSI
jgi:hypothetical protein